MGTGAVYTASTNILPVYFYGLIAPVERTRYSSILVVKPETYCTYVPPNYSQHDNTEKGQNELKMKNDGL